MADSSFCRLALSGHRLRPLCPPNDPNEGPGRSKNSFATPCKWSSAHSVQEKSSEQSFFRHSGEYG